MTQTEPMTIWRVSKGEVVFPLTEAQLPDDVRDAVITTYVQHGYTVTQYHNQRPLVTRRGRGR